MKTKLRDSKYYIENFLQIRTKSGKVELLKAKPAQQRLHDEIERCRAEKKPVRFIILKARQLGFSTWIEAEFFADTATHEASRTLIVAHDDDATTNLFRMNKRFYDGLPDQIKPMRTASNSKEIIFDNPERDPQEKAKHPGLGSSIRCVPATGPSVGRSDTLTNVHASEVAFWRDMGETFTALLQAVPDDPHTSVIVETTPNGYNGFKDLWDLSVEGKTGFTPLFFPWYEEPGYTREPDPGTEWTEEEEMLRSTYHLTDGQLAWRRWCIATNMVGDAEKFKQEYPSCPEEAFLTSGNPYFNNNLLIARLNQLQSKPIRGRYIFEEDAGGKPVNWHFEEADDGEVYIYTRPEERTPYVLAGDTAGDGSDRFTGYLLNNATSEQVAMLLYDGTSELYYTQQMYCLSADYNHALTGIEINYSTYPEKKLEEWQTQHLYIREKPDDSRGQLSTYKWGWRTDLRTRPLILANLHTMLSESPEVVLSEEILRECLTFIRNENMRPEAAQGKHDDLVMAMAIAYYIRPQQSYEMAEEEQPQYIKAIDRIDPKGKMRKRWA